MAETSYARLHIDGRPSPIRVKIARTWLSRARGLLGTQSLGTHEGLWLRPCDSVHTLGMAYAIDVAFVDKKGRVMKVAEQLPPWRMAGCWRAAGTLEVAAGTLLQLGVGPGTALTLVSP